MPAVRIVTDSTADLPEELYQKHDISRVPLKVLIGQEVYRDGVDISTRQFYQYLQQGETAGTSQPSPGEFAQLFASLTADGSQVLCLTLSSHFSGTYQSARVAAGMVNGTVEVIDTKSATRGVGLLAMAAAQAAAKGKTLQEIKDLVYDLIPKMRVFFLVDSLQYLERGGRIGKAQAFLGTLLNIKPLLCVKEGIVHPYEKVRGKNKGLERIIQIAEQDTAGAEIICAVLDGNDPAARAVLYQKARERLNCREIWQGNIGPVIGSHVGPGVSGIIYYRA